MLARNPENYNMAHDDHDHDHEGSELSPIALRVRALESLLTEKGYIDPAALDVLIDTYETRIGPRNGARVVAKAWTDAAYADWLKTDATAAIESLGYVGRQGEHMVAVFNTPDTHNMVVCTLCSCYPWTALPRRDRSARRAGGVRLDASCGDKDSSLGFDRGSPLPRGAAAARRQRWID
jgi:Nitrile hydratase, alpha chain